MFKSVGWLIGSFGIFFKINEKKPQTLTMLTCEWNWFICTSTVRMLNNVCFENFIMLTIYGVHARWEYWESKCL